MADSLPVAGMCTSAWLTLTRFPGAVTVCSTSHLFTATVCGVGVGAGVSVVEKPRYPAVEIIRRPTRENRKIARLLTVKLQREIQIRFCLVRGIASFV
jgi:hypothetical protein